MILDNLRTASVQQAPDSIDEETTVVGRWLAEWRTNGLAPEEIGVFVRSDAELSRARAAVERAGLSFTVLDHAEATSGRVAIATMHRSKGLEYRAVALMACGDDIVPLQARVEGVTEAADLDDVYDTERHLLYVACTRARDHLLVAGVRPASEFSADLS